LPFPNGAFDAVAVAFGVRNIADRVGALREFNRVVRSGGAIRVLEVLEPKASVWRRIVRAYQRSVIPIIGAVFARQRLAYEYFVRSIAGFGAVEALEAELRAGGWTPEGTRGLAGGSVVLVVGRKAGLPGSEGAD
jgi:demethylmenaquinone methyltransferase/2-methoxy-6-polyprenyl-1,4-benzoquinol methylase